MTPAEQAAADLKAIRGLMEKATIYQAISAPSAFVAGCLAVLAATVFELGFLQERKVVFGLVWGLVLAVCLTVNGIFLWLAAAERQEPFISSGMKLAIQAMSGPVLVALAFTLHLGWSAGYPLNGPDFFGRGASGVWILFYGLALLATLTFAPRSIIWLGASFVAAGLIFMLQPIELWPTFSPGSQRMGLTFGLFHLIYAAVTWFRRPSPR